MRILVVEDEPVLRSQLIRSLKEENHSVDSAENGEEGLYKMQHGVYELVILDVMMPMMDGFEVLQQARAAGVDAVVLMLTARDSLSDRVHGLDIGADDYLVKPFNLKELKARVRSLLRRKSSVSTNVIRAANVVLDLNSKLVTKDGEIISLTGREYAIVEVLLRRKGQIVSKTVLYENAVDETDDSMSNLLDVHVYNVRQKLGKEFIKTVRGQGYIVGDLPG